MTIRIFKLTAGCAAAVLAALFSGPVKAADFPFYSGPALAAVQAGLHGADLPLPAAAAGARTYDFQTLYGSLGYPSPTYFGSSGDEVMDLEAYTSKSDSFYSEINGYLRFYPGPYTWYGTGPEDAKLIVEHMDHVFSRAPALPADLMLFRGLGLKFRGSEPYTIGEEFLDKGYVSTSTSYKVARYFAIEMGAAEDDGSRKAVFALYLGRPGEKGILVDQGEDEVILKHVMKFRVMAKKDGVKKYDLYLVQACADVCAAAVPRDAGVFWAGLSVND